MFNNLRDKIQSVVQQGDLSLSFRDFTIGSVKTDPDNNESASSTNLNKFNYDLDVNLYAGVDIIEYFQNHWTKIQDQTNQNIMNLRTAQENIEVVDSKIKKLNSVFQKLDQNIDTLTPKIEESFNEIETELNKSLNLLFKLNDAITELKEKKIHLGFADRKNQSKKKLVEMMIRRSEDLALYENQLNSKHEKQKSEILRERQMVFQQAFEEELKIYKEKGVILIKPIAAKNLKNQNDEEPKLEDISLEIDEDEVKMLEQFLKDD